MTCPEVRNGTARIEEELQKSEQRYRTLFEQSRDAICITTRDGKFVDANQAMLDLFGYTREELLELNVVEIYRDQADRPRYQREVEQKGYVVDWEVRMRKKNGTNIDCLLTSTLVVSDDGKIQGYQGVIRDVTEQRRRDNMHSYLVQVTKAQEEERRRVARELHDETTQALISLCMDIETLSTSMSKNKLPVRFLNKLEELRLKTMSIMHDVRRISPELRPDILDRNGLVPALELLADELNHNWNISTHVDKDGEEKQLPAEVELALFRITQEALNNVRKHANATNAIIDIHYSPSEVQLTVSDNGRGFQVPQNISQLICQNKLGILGMQERVHLLGGTFSIESRLGEGTTVTVTAKIPG